MQDLPLLKPCCDNFISKFRSMWFTILILIIDSNNLQGTQVRLMSLSFLALPLLPFLCIGVTLANNQSVGTSDDFRDLLNIIARGSASSSQKVLRTKVLIPSGPQEFVFFNFDICSFVWLIV